MTLEESLELRSGFETAYIDGSIASNYAYKPQFIINNHKQGKKVLSSIEDELLACDHYQISVAFITMGGITPLLQTLKELDKKGVKGEILTTNYLNFSEPKALEKLNSLNNVTLKMYDTQASGDGFHTKGYIFKKGEIYRIIIGSSNMTKTALTSNHEWNTRFVSTSKGEIAQCIMEEFHSLWNSEYAFAYEQIHETYKEQFITLKSQRDLVRLKELPKEKYLLKPNTMQTKFIENLKTIIEENEERALLISATGTGKTYASAFAMRELGFQRVLFLVHRGQLAKQTKKSYRRVFGPKFTMGLVGAGYSDYDADYIFATVQTLNRDEHLYRYHPEEFDCIILDEAHHSSAHTYQKVMNYFKPKFWLGMTATPDKRDDDQIGRNIYEIFNHKIAYEIRLQQAMEEDLLCPFHYFGISELSMIEEKQLKSRKMNEKDFNLLTADERVQHIIEQAQYYGYSGNKVKGLVFCSRIDESEILSHKFNELGYRTIALNGSASEEQRAEAFERLAMDEEDATEDMKPLDYIFSVEILNEGVDIVEVNQVIMLRPTESPIVFVQQLGRGLRKAEGKEYVVILDFIGNYNNNFMIPVALSGDRSYNPDTIRKYVISGNTTIPGASTIHFDSIAKEKIFASIDKIKGIKAIIRSSYQSLKNRLGRIPYLLDFYGNNEVDPLVIIREYKTYQSFLEIEEKELVKGTINDDEKLVIEYLSKTILSGIRPYELEILKRLLHQDKIDIKEMKEELINQYGYFDMDSFQNALSVLKGCFVSKEEEYQKYRHINILDTSNEGILYRMEPFALSLQHDSFQKQVEDLIEVGLRRYQEKYHKENMDECSFVLYEKYSRRDVSLLMNCGKDLSSVMYGMKRIQDDVFIFVTYHKEESNDDKVYVEGKPDYADAFEDQLIFKWDSQIGKGVHSSYMQDVCGASRKHLFVKKSDAESNFYYMGMFDIIDIKADMKKDNHGKMRDITKVKMQMRHAVRDDLLRYLQSGLYKGE